MRSPPRSSRLPAERAHEEASSRGDRALAHAPRGALIQGLRRAGRAGRRGARRLQRAARRGARRLRGRVRRIRRLPRRLRRRHSGLWERARGPRLRLGLYRDATERLLHALARDRGRVRFVQIGANDGIAEDPIHLFVTRDGWRGVVVEPGGSCARLRATYAHTPGIRVEEAAVDAVSGTRDLFVLEGENLPRYADRLSSLSERVVAEKARRLPGSRVARHPVPCVTFDELCARHGVVELDLLVLDTEGHDFAILQSIDLARWRPALILYEQVNLLAPGPCREHLEGLGYRVVPVEKDAVAVAHDALAGHLARAWRVVEGRASRRNGKPSPARS